MQCDDQHQQRVA